MTLSTCERLKLCLLTLFSPSSFDAGRGNKILSPGSIVTAEMTIRCKSLATQKDPGGKRNILSASFRNRG